MKKIYYKILCSTLSILLMFCFTNISYLAEYQWSSPQTTIETSTTLDSNENSDTLNLESGAAILIDQKTGQILYEYNSHEQLRPASVTKIMSILLIMEAIDSGEISLDDQVSCSEKASSMGGSQIWLTTTETLSVRDMLKSICIVSANDCTVAMAEYLCGSTEAFVEKMNQKAQELGMNDTCFKNCHGIDEDGHLSSAYDIAIMSRELLEKHPSITTFTTTWMDTIRDGKSELVNTNKLLRNYEGCTGLKTGSTSLALYNLSASATRNNSSLIAVILKAPTTATRFSEAKELLDYGFNNFTSVTLSEEKQIVKNITIEKGVEPSINAICSKTQTYSISKGNESKITQVLNIPDSLSAPIEKDQKIGEIQYLLDDQVICTVDIISDKAVEKSTFLNMSEYILKKWFNLLRT